MNRTLIIAEVGVNHNADLNIAQKLIEAAKDAGSDAVKFQAAIPEKVATHYAQKADYQKHTLERDESQLGMIRKIHFPLKVYKHLKESCERKEILFLASAFDLTSLAFIQELGPAWHKIPSGEITNLPFLTEIGRYSKPVILSTGMSTLGEIEAAISVLEKSGTLRSQISLLHCTTEYPTPMEEVHLRAIPTLRNAFGVDVGYSDHTSGMEVAIAAVALGASIIEKHLTLERNLPGPDHKASLEPLEFKSMVDAIRNVEQALGKGIKRLALSEAKNRSVVRKSIVASCRIKSGEVFSAENLTTKRPGIGISPMRWDEVMGRRANRDFEEDELITL